MSMVFLNSDEQLHHGNTLAGYTANYPA